jgi:SAM-dependent methyltransferase
MNEAPEDRKQRASLKLARTDPGKLYDAEYYRAGCSTDGAIPYGRHGHWLKFFARVARKLKRRYRPRTAVDIGCAYGLLVEALCDRGIDAYGYDISPYAISNARDDMRDRLHVHSILDPIPLRDGKKYDLAICIEVLEHLPPENAAQAVANLCAASDRILFSSSPDDFEEPTHFNVLPTSEWLKLFAKNGFQPAKKPTATFVAKHAFVVESAQAIQPGLLARLLWR